MTPKRSKLWLGLAAMLVAGSAFAQVDCSRVPDDLQPRCELVNRMRERCANVEEKARAACERDSLRLPTHEDCSRVPEPAKRSCEQHNRAVDKIERCAKLTGTDREACLRSNASRPGYRQL